MVTFVCSVCNTSLKKNQVSLHSCKGNYSCITCSSSFSKLNFKFHDQCITEAEKYQGSDFKPKSTDNKGDVKQKNWATVAFEALSKYETSDIRLREIINFIKNKPNIPMKESPFNNFVNNFPKAKYSPGCAKIIWGILKEAKDNMSLPAKDSKCDQIDVVVNSNSTQVDFEKKSKKRKHADLDTNNLLDTAAKKKKNSEKYVEPINCIGAVSIIEPLHADKTMSNIVEAKDKKKSLLSEINIESISVDNTTSNSVEIVPVNDDKKKSKKKKKKSSISEINIEPMSVDNTTSNSVEIVPVIEDKKKSKKKKSKKNALVEVVGGDKETKKSGTDGQLEDIIKSATEVVKQVLHSSIDNGDSKIKKKSKKR